MVGLVSRCAHDCALARAVPYMYLTPSGVSAAQVSDTDCAAQAVKASMVKETRILTKAVAQVRHGAQRTLAREWPPAHLVCVCHGFTVQASVPSPTDVHTFGASRCHGGCSRHRIERDATNPCNTFWFPPRPIDSATSHAEALNE